MTPALDIRGAGTAFAVLHGGRVVGRATSHGNALALLPGIERRLAQVTRLCLSCGTPFTSSGKGNRICPACKAGG